MRAQFFYEEALLAECDASEIEGDDAIGWFIEQICGDNKQIQDGGGEGEGLGFFSLRISPKSYELCAEGDDVMTFEAEDPFEGHSFDTFLDLVRKHLEACDTLRVVITQDRKQKKAKINSF
jgi:hypothetical protein